MRLARLFIALTVLSASLTPAFSPTPASAQSGPGSIPCAGTLNIIRVSEVKPGMMDKFRAAVAAQAAWYKKAGTSDQIQVMSILSRDAATKAWSTSTTEAMTTHTIQSSRPDPANDAGFDAFVAMFSASSTIKTTYMTCLAP
jgi:hypothetical protein